MVDRSRPPGEGGVVENAEPTLSLLLTESGVAQVHWSVDQETWARLDAEFPGSAGATHAMLRLRLTRWNGTVQEVAAQDLDRGTRTRQGASMIPLSAEGDYEAELGLASEDGGWLLLRRSERRRLVLRRSDDARSGRLATSASDAPVEPPLVGSPDGSLAATRPPERREGGLPSALAGRTPDQRLDPPQEASRQGAGAVRTAPSARPTRVSAATLVPRPGSQQGWAQGPATAGYASPARSPEGLELQAELVLHGSAPPGTIVDLFGRTVRVGPGGAFSLRVTVQDPDLLRQALSQPSRPEPPSNLEHDDRMPPGDS